MALDSEGLRTQLGSLIGLVRQKMDPTTVEVAEAFAHAALASQRGEVIYDRESAHEAVRLFMQTKSVDPEFRQRLASRLREPAGDAENQPGTRRE